MLSKLKENVVSVADSAVKKAAKIGTSSGRGNNEGDSDESEDGDDYLTATLPTMPSEIPRATGDKQWFGAILGKDGCIYCIPCNANRVLRINPKTGQLSTFENYPKEDGSGDMEPLLLMARYTASLTPLPLSESNAI